MLISRGIKVGNTIEFDYDDPLGKCKNGKNRTGILSRMYRAKKTNYLMYVIVDHSFPLDTYKDKPEFRQFRYRNMRNIKVTSNADSRFAAG
jgi:hypothetical protein